MHSKIIYKQEMRRPTNVWKLEFQFSASNWLVGNTTDKAREDATQRCCFGELDATSIFSVNKILVGIETESSMLENPQISYTVPYIV